LLAHSYLEMLRTAPVVPASELTGNRPFVVLSPHPDDETLGTGGLIAEACTIGQKVEVIIVTDGSGSHPKSTKYPRQKLVELRYAEVHQAGLALGLASENISFLGLPDTRAPKSGPQFEAAVEATMNIIRRSGAEALFVTWERDPHCDHEASAELAKAVRRLCPDLKLWAYPIWGWHIEPNAEVHQPTLKAIRIDISKHKVRKLAAIEAHASQMTDLISDDPEGFRFNEQSLAPFLGNCEYFIEVPL
jgi:LmbE family N-acetylglucosaminyl deacetylase